jgi:cell division protease FtsH
MTLTDDELTDTTAALTGGDDARRRPITDVSAWLDDLDSDVRPTLRALGELLVGVAERGRAESADKFTARCLGVPDSGHLLDEERKLNPVSR